MKSAKIEGLPCVVCNASGAEKGDYCEAHREELHRLDHQYQSLFRLQRTARGKDHESYNLFLHDNCQPCGRVLVTETDPENLAITVLIANDLNLDTVISEYDSLRLRRTYGDLLRDRIQQEIIHSWYGNARACVDLFTTNVDQPQHWDVAPRDEESGEEEGYEPQAPEGGNSSIH